VKTELFIAQCRGRRQIASEKDFFLKKRKIADDVLALKKQINRSTHVYKW
jgi:hypothetical protein